MGEVYEPRSGCPINATIEVFGDPWSLLVLRDIVFGDRRYFRELQAAHKRGSPQIFSTDRLKRLVELGLLTQELQLLDLRALPSLDQAAAAAGLARHAVFHRRLAGVDEPVAPPVDRLCRDSVSTSRLRDGHLMGQHREHQLQPRLDRHRVVAPAQDRTPCHGSAPKPARKSDAHQLAPPEHTF
jgi:hypothetical protein